MNSRFRITMLVLCLFVGFETQASAYTDPGTGALIWQMIAAGLVGATFYFRRIRVAIANFLKKSDKEQ